MEDFWHRASKKRAPFIIDPGIGIRCSHCRTALVPVQSLAKFALPCVAAMVLVVGVGMKKVGFDLNNMSVGIWALLPLGIFVATSFKIYPRLLRLRPAAPGELLSFPMDVVVRPQTVGSTESGGDAWTCSRCAEKNPVAFETCWSCAAEPPTVPSNNSLERSRDR
ncbi:MAG: hypothetical protein RL030_2559 [Pseudomonadota bacterium]|jgi:hypothetical protein